MWSNVANVTFDKVTQNVDLAAQMTFGYSGPGNFAYFPQWEKQPGIPPNEPDRARYASYSGDVWIDPSIASLDAGTVGFEILLHEIGHGLGLNHSETSSSIYPTIDSIGVTPLPTSDSYTLFSVMSYAEESPAISMVSPKISGRRAITPMLYDIAAIQRLYGANTAYKGENGTVWAFSDQTHPFSDLLPVTSPFRSPDAVLMTLWDGGGAGDVVDASEVSTSSRINLTPGEFSRIAVTGPDASLRGNVVIAFNSTIENARGGAGNDVLIGNAIANSLEGNAGADTLDGGVAANAGMPGVGRGFGDGQGDTLVGGAGSDTFVIRVNGGNDVIQDSGVGDRIELRDGNDIPLEYVRAAFWQPNGDYLSHDGLWKYTLNSSLQIIDNQSGQTLATVLDFEDSDYGIRLIDAPTVPTTTNVIDASLKPKVFQQQIMGTQPVVLTGSGVSPGGELIGGLSGGEWQSINAWLQANFAGYAGEGVGLNDSIFGERGKVVFLARQPIIGACQ
jgi:hypothetical protein